MRLRAIAFAGLATVLGGPALAHHSFAMFDANKTTELAGTVKEFEWISPHAWLHMAVLNESGKTVTWSFEAGSPSQLMASGWKKDSIKEGDKITLGFHPLKDGSFGGQLLNVKLPDGKNLCQGAACRAAAATQ